MSVDTSREAVENMCTNWGHDTYIAALLRALADERDAAEARERRLREALNGLYSNAVGKIADADLIAIYGDTPMLHAISAARAALEPPEPQP